MIVTFETLELAKNDCKLKNEILQVAKNKFLLEGIIIGIIKNLCNDDNDIEEFIRSIDVGIIKNYKYLVIHFIYNKNYSSLEYILSIPETNLYFPENLNNDVKVFNIIYNHKTNFLKNTMWQLIIKSINFRIMDVLDFLHTFMKDLFCETLVNIFNKESLKIDIDIANFLVNNCLNIFDMIEDHKIYCECINTFNLFRCYNIMSKLKIDWLINNDIELVYETQNEIKFYDWYNKNFFQFNDFKKMIFSTICDRIEFNINDFIENDFHGPKNNVKNTYLVNYVLPKLLPKYSKEIQNKIIVKLSDYIEGNF